MLNEKEVREMTDKKITLLIDQDDVLADYMGAVVAAYNEKYHTDIKRDACVSWNLYTVFGKEIDTVMHEPDLFRNLKPIPHALEVFERLYMSNLFEMYIVTAANPRAVEAKYEWIEKYLPFFPKNHIIVCSSKFMIKGDYLLDDGMHNIEDFANAGGKSVVFDKPHNMQNPHSYPHVSSWLEFETFIMNECYPERIQEHFQEEAIS